MSEIVCIWKAENNEYMPGTYESTCGIVWTFTEGGVKDNGVNFCFRCGKKVEEELNDN